MNLVQMNSDYRNTKKFERRARAQLHFRLHGNATCSVQVGSCTAEAGGTLCTIRPGKAFTKDLPNCVKFTDVLCGPSSLKSIVLGTSTFRSVFLLEEVRQLEANN
jgi:hypothetical protein